jgi:hypothetical protein
MGCHAQFRLFVVRPEHRIAGTAHFEGTGCLEFSHLKNRSAPVISRKSDVRTAQDVGHDAFVGFKHVLIGCGIYIVCGILVC